MVVLKWIYGRIGQILCFAFAIGALLFSSDYSGDIKPGNIAAAAVLFATGLVLRHQMLRGRMQRGAEEPAAPKPTSRKESPPAPRNAESVASYDYDLPNLSDRRTQDSVQPERETSPRHVLHPPQSPASPVEQPKAVLPELAAIEPPASTDNSQPATEEDRAAASADDRSRLSTKPLRSTASRKPAPLWGALAIMVAVGAGAGIWWYLPSGRDSIENAAYSFTQAAEAWSAGLVVLGAVIAGLVARVSFNMQRVVYFFSFGAIVMVSTSASAVWISFPAAMLADSVWILAAITVVAFLLTGYFFGVAAIARSRDAYGHGSMAPLAFIPLANLWLMLRDTASPKQLNAVHQVTSPGGPLGVVLGVALLIFAGIAGRAIEEQVSLAVATIESDPAYQRKALQRSVGNDGLATTLKNIASEVLTPAKVDGITTLVRVEADGTTLRYINDVTDSSARITEELRAFLTKQVCASGLRELIKEGATVEYRYDARTSWLGTITVNESRCP